MTILDYINEKRVCFIDKKNKISVLNELILMAFEIGVLKDKKGFKKAIEEREAVISTGIGLGAAFPHAKINNIKDFFVITAVLKEPVDWDSFDQRPVQVVFLIGGPEDKQKDYLKILSSLMIIIKDDEKRERIINSKTAEDVIKVFKQENS